MDVELTVVDANDLPTPLPLIAGYHAFEGIASDADTSSNRSLAADGDNLIGRD